MELIMSSLPKTWIFDIDGTIVKHNGYKNDGDILLDGVKELFDKIPEPDMIIFMSAREEKYRNITEKFLLDNGIRFDMLILGVPVGERILINDDKLSGICMSYAVRKERNSRLDIKYTIDKDL